MPTCTGRRVRAGWGETQGGSPLPGHLAQKGPLTAMQIRLTVLAPYAGHGAGRACDVLVTAPAGTALAAVASNLAAAVTGPETSASGTTVLYAGAERLDGRRCALGSPALDGGVGPSRSPDRTTGPTRRPPPGCTWWRARTRAQCTCCTAERSESAVRSTPTNRSTTRTSPAPTAR
ncbi:hypothetical protein STANM309S_02128 [Streptomyces tanashiensis]